MRVPALGRLFTSKTGVPEAGFAVTVVGAGAGAGAAVSAVTVGDFAVADVVASASLVDVATVGARGADATGDAEAGSVFAKIAIAASTRSGSSAATNSHEKRLRRDAARTRSVGSGR